MYIIAFFAGWKYFLLFLSFQGMFVGILFSCSPCLYGWCFSVSTLECVYKCVGVFVVCNPHGWVDVCEWAVSSVPDLPAVCLNEGLIGLASWIRAFGNERGLGWTPDNSPDEGDEHEWQTTTELYSLSVYARYEGLECVRTVFNESNLVKKKTGLTRGWGSCRALWPQNKPSKCDRKWLRSVGVYWGQMRQKHALWRAMGTLQELCLYNV